MKLVWPTIILLSTLAAGLVNFVVPDLPGRPFILLWFLCVCPGMTLTRFFRLQELTTEWTLAIVLSLTIDAAVTGVQIYAGHWSPALALTIIMGICAIGVFIQGIQAGLSRKDV